MTVEILLEAKKGVEGGNWAARILYMVLPDNAGLDISLSTGEPRLAVEIVA